MKALYNEYWNTGEEPREQAHRRTRTALLWRELQRRGITSVGRFLEVGCGEGHLVAEAAGRGADAIGIDISETGIERAKRFHQGLTFLVHDVEEQSWPVDSASFDVVASFEVLEHLLRPRQLIIGAHAALKPGGLLALTTPYHGVVKNFALVLRGFERHFNPEGPHIRFFTDAAVKRMLQEQGYRDLHLVHFGRTWGLWAGLSLPPLSPNVRAEIGFSAIMANGRLPRGTTAPHGWPDSPENSLWGNSLTV